MKSTVSFRRSYRTEIEKVQLWNSLSETEDTKKDKDALEWRLLC